MSSSAGAQQRQSRCFWRNHARSNSSGVWSSDDSAKLFRYACTCSPAPRVQRCFSYYSGYPTPPSLLHCSEDQIVNLFSWRNGRSLLQYIPPRGSSSSCSDAPLPHVLSHSQHQQTQTVKDRQKEGSAMISVVLDIYIFYLIKVMIKLWQENSLLFYHPFRTGFKVVMVVS